MAFMSVPRRRYTLPALPVPKKRSPFGAVACESTKGSLIVASLCTEGPGRSSPREVTAKPSMSPARNSSAERTRQNCGATAKAFAASSEKRRAKLLCMDCLDGRLHVDVDHRSAVDDGAEG